MKIYTLLLIVVILLLSSCKANWYRHKVCRTNQIFIQSIYSDKYQRYNDKAYLNWSRRPKDNTILFIFKVD